MNNLDTIQEDSQQEEIQQMDVELADNQDLDSFLESIQVELSDFQPTPESNARYKDKLDLMSTIHNSPEYIEKVNAKRDAHYKGFFRPEDQYIPETGNNDFFSLWQTVASQLVTSTIPQ